jgi:acetyl-CoA/propionyl-CoA carboxylase carboxyl transferase subunit
MDETGPGADLRNQRERTGRNMDEARIERQHSKGKQTAYERIDYLLDDGTFCELDTFVEHQCDKFGLDERRDPGDAVITGHGKIDGRTVVVYAHDFTFLGGSVSEVVADKICKVIDWALDNGVPVIGLNDSGGARIQEGLDALCGFARIFAKHTEASGRIPQISVIMGPCAGGATYAPALTDFIFMVEGTSNAFITGPDVVETVTGEDVSKEELGGAQTHTIKSGVAHGSHSDEEEVLDEIKRLLTYLPQHCGESPPTVSPQDDPHRETPELTDIVPTQLSKPYDVREVVCTIVDEGSFSEMRASWARNLVTGFARLDGQPVGVLANQPRASAGTLDIEAAQKGARFVRFCDAFNLPVVTLVDVPGFMPGTKQEYGGIIRHGAKLIHAYADASVPLLTVVTRKAYGGAYIVMGSKHLGADINYAWPNAEMAVLGPRPAARILYGDEIAEADDPEARREELMETFRDQFANPYGPAKRGYIDDVIAPGETRQRLAADLAAITHRPPTYPEKAHDNIPL